MSTLHARTHVWALVMMTLSLFLSGLVPAQAVTLTDTASIEGIVTDATGPLDGIEVTLYENQGTDAQPSWVPYGAPVVTLAGGYRFENLRADSWTLEFSDTDVDRALTARFSTGTDLLPSSGAAETPGVITTDGVTAANFDFAMASAPAPEADGSITGRVLNPDGTPSEYTSVEAYRADALPEDEPVASAITYGGAYDLHVPAGDYQIRITVVGDYDWDTKTRPKYETTYYGGGAGMVVSVGAGETVELEPVQLVEVSGATVTGRVLDAGVEDGVGVVPFANIAVYRIHSDHDFALIAEGTADETGVYEVGGITVNRPHVVCATYEWVSHCNGGANWIFEAEPLVLRDGVNTLEDIGLPRDRVISGTVTFDGTRPTGDIWVSADRWDTSVSPARVDVAISISPDADGSYAIHDLSPGTYTLAVVHGAYRGAVWWPSNSVVPATQPTATNSIVIGAEDFAITGKDIHVPQLRTLTGKVTTTSGTPLVGTNMSLLVWEEASGIDDQGNPVADWGRVSIRTRTAADGSYSVEAPAGSVVTVEASRDGFPSTYPDGATVMPSGPSDQGALTVGDGDLANLDLVMAPSWDTLGAVAAERAEYCLSNPLRMRPGAARRIAFPLTIGGTQYDSVVVNAGATLSFDGPVRTYNPALLGPKGQHPVVAAFMADIDGSWDQGNFASYGVSPDGTKLCAIWVDASYENSGRANTYQAILTSKTGEAGREQGDFDVTLNYDRVQWSRQARAGWSAGTGAEGSFAKIPGFENGGYRDNQPTGLIHGSLGSTKAGQYLFEVRNAPLGDAPVATTPPTITGDAVFGGTLAADSGEWSTAEASLSHQWLRNGEVITGATAATYSLAAADVDQKVSVRVTATQPGHRQGVAESAAVTVTAAPAVANVSAPTLPSEVTVGELTYADEGVWEADGLLFTYEWTVDGVVTGTGPGYTPTADDLGGALKVQVTASKPGHEDAVAVSAPVLVGAGAPAVATVLPEINGAAVVGDELTASTGVWDVEGLSYGFQWMVDGVPVASAHGATFTPLLEHVGGELSVTVTATRPGYEDGVAGSASVRVASAAAGANTELPSITGDARVDQVLQAEPGTWDSADLSFSYQWLVDGAPVSGATDPTYAVQRSDLGKQVKVRVTASRTDYADVAAESAPTVAVARGDAPSATVLPEITGVPQPGRQVGATPGAWSSDGLTFGYRWFLDGAPVGTGAGYTPRAADAGKQLTVRVTGSSSWYVDGNAESGPVTVLAAEASTGGLTGRVLDGTGGELAQADVAVCDERYLYCDFAETGADGSFSVDGLPFGDYRVHVSAPWGSGLIDALAQHTVTADSADSLVEIKLEAVKPVPTGTTLTMAGDTAPVQSDVNEPPSVYYASALDLTVTGCATVPDPTYTVTLADGTTKSSGPLATSGDGVYTATIPAFYPDHGSAVISTNVPLECGEEPISFHIYIDPSGIITDQFGQPLEGAKVTLLRSETELGSYEEVQDGSIVMSEGNRNNPSFTDSVGYFRWDVTEGWYKVRAESSRCIGTTTPGMSVPPERVDLLIKLDCPEALAPTAVVAPEISGSPAVGETLSVSSATWPEPLVARGIEWFRGDTLVAVGATYTVTAADQGHTVRAVESAGRPNYRQENGAGTIVSFASVTASDSVSVPGAPSSGGGGGGSTPTPLPEDGPKATTVPSLSGTPRVGNTLSVEPGVWDADGLTFEFQWLRNGRVIGKATASRYTLTPDDLGGEITVEVTGKAASGERGTATTTSLTVLAGAAPKVVEMPSASGNARAGGTLTADPGTWTAQGLSYRYQWLVDGAPLAGADDQTLRLTRAQAGRDVSVVVTATRRGYADGRREAAAVRVAKLRSVTAADLRRSTVLTGRRAVLDVEVLVKGLAHPRGRLVVKVDGHRVSSARLGHDASGEGTIRLPKLSGGRHRVLVVYRGTAQVSRSRSEVIGLLVRK